MNGGWFASVCLCANVWNNIKFKVLHDVLIPIVCSLKDHSPTMSFRYSIVDWILRCFGPCFLYFARISKANAPRQLTKSLANGRTGGRLEIVLHIPNAASDARRRPYNWCIHCHSNEMHHNPMWCIGRTLPLWAFRSMKTFSSFRC